MAGYLLDLQNTLKIRFSVCQIFSRLAGADWSLNHEPVLIISSTEA